MSIEAMKKALEALEESHPEAYRNVITSLRQAIAEAEKQEPMAWVETHDNGEINWGVETVISDDPSWLDRPMPVHITPPQRQPLHDDDMSRLVEMVPMYSDDSDHAYGIRIGRTVEAAHGIKENNQKGETD